VSDNRFLQSFCAFLGAATLVCGTQLFLLATWDWDATPSDVEPAIPANATISVKVLVSKPAETVAEHDADLAPISVETAAKNEMLEESEPELTHSSAFQQPDVLSEASQSTASTAPADTPTITAEARVGDRTPPASATVNLLVAESRIMGDAAVHRTPVASTSGNLLVPGITGEGRFDNKTVFASVSTNLSADAPTKNENTDAEPKPKVTEVGYGAVPELRIAAFKRVENTGADGDALDVQIAQAGSQASEREEKALQPLAADKAYARKQPLAHKIAQRQQLQPQPTASFSDAAELKPKQSTLKALLPQRATQSWKKKSSAQAEANEKLMPKLARTPHTKNSRVTPRWKPMGLAPIDKPAISSSQSQQKGPGPVSYNAKIWSALARKKPKAGQRGSTTVTFAIGPGGALRSVRVSQSSSNPRLDQLAVATVRNAAPFPPPKILKNGTAAYSIRIDFH